MPRSIENRYVQTCKRRALQPLWNALEQAFTPLNKPVLPVLLAISGGPDSRALMEAFAVWKSRLAFRPFVAVVDHQLRAESFKEAQLVKGRAQLLGFDAEVLTAFPASTNEADCRAARYEALWAFAQRHPIKTLVTAHHQDDEAESMLMDLLGLGGGPEGAGMGSVTQMPQGQITRPFLRLSKAQLLCALHALGIRDYFQDGLDKKALSQRSRVRQKLLPSLSAYHPHINKRLAQRANQLKELRDAAEAKLTSLEIAHPSCLEAREIPRSLFRLQLIKSLKQLSPQTDFRSSARIIEEIAASLYEALDPEPKWVTLSSSRKQYALPGVQVRVEGSRVFLNKTRL